MVIFYYSSYTGIETEIQRRSYVLDPRLAMQSICLRVADLAASEPLQRTGIVRFYGCSLLPL